MNQTSRLISALGVALALGLGITGCSMETIHGSGKIITKSQPINGVTSIDMSGRGHLVINQNGSESLSITTDDNLMPYLTSAVTGTTLRLETKRNTNLDPTHEILYNVSVKKLNAIAAAGMATIEASNIKTDSLQIESSGLCTVTVAGQADQQQIAISGACDYEAPHLATKSTTIEIAGSGKATVAASSTLNASVSGAGSIKYIGNPQVTQHISGIGSVEKD